MTIPILGNFCSFLNWEGAKENPCQADLSPWWAHKSFTGSWCNHAPTTVNFLKFRTLFSFSNKMLLIRAGIHKIVV